PHGGGACQSGSSPPWITSLRSEPFRPIDQIEFVFDWSETKNRPAGPRVGWLSSTPAGLRMVGRWGAINCARPENPWDAMSLLLITAMLDPAGRGEPPCACFAWTRVKNSSPS